MPHWPLDQSLMDLPWIGGLAATPLAIVAEILARASRIRPAARHALWAAVLVSFLTPALAHAIGHPSWLASRLTTALGFTAESLVAAASVPSVPPVASVAWATPDALDTAPAAAGPWPLHSDLVAARRLLKPRWDWSGFTRRVVALREALTSLSPLSPVVWAIGLATIVGLRISRLIAMRRILRTARPAPRRITRVVQQVADEIGLDSAPETLLTDEAISPLVTCGVRPRLVLPAAMLPSLDDLARCSVLVLEALERETEGAFSAVAVQVGPHSAAPLGVGTQPRVRPGSSPLKSIRVRRSPMLALPMLAPPPPPARTAPLAPPSPPAPAR